MAERAKVARRYGALLGIGVPILVDTLDNRTGRDYRAQPVRLCVVGRDGNLVYAGSGAGNVNVAEMAAALETLPSCSKRIEPSRS